MIKRGLQWLMQQRFVLQCLIGLCVVSMVSTLKVSNTAPKQEQEASLAVSVELSATAQTASNKDNVASADINENDIENYAQAVLKIEAIRLSTLSSIQTILESETIPSIACHQEDTVKPLPEDAQELVVTFCQASIGLVEQAGLSIEEFNQITTAQQSNEALQTAVQDALLRLQTIVGERESVPSSE
ncbi:MAG: DUF4168 domain-containing protein [Cyanobacteria bacterium P01_F01_bin.150]